MTPPMVPPIVPIIPYIPGTPPDPDGKCQNPGDELHHMLPQEFEEWFGAQGLKVQDPTFLRCVPKGCHRLKSDNGLHTNQNGPGTNYNALWAQFRRTNPSATAQQMLDQLAQLAQQFAAQLECEE